MGLVRKLGRRGCPLTVSLPLKCQVRGLVEKFRGSVFLCFPGLRQIFITRTHHISSMVEELFGREKRVWVGSVSKDIEFEPQILWRTHLGVQFHGPVTQKPSLRTTKGPHPHSQFLPHKTTRPPTPVRVHRFTSRGILTWRGRGSCSPKRVINKARRLIEYTALHAAVCGRLWLQLRLYVRRIIFVRVGLCACRRPRTQQTNRKTLRVCVQW